METVTRSHSYQPVKTTSLYYRVRVTFDNGRTHYSNVTMLRGSQAVTSKPFLVGNVISSNLTVNSPAAFDYAIYDMNGRQVAKGRLSQGLNTVSTGYMTNGMYILHYTSNGEQFSEKFMKK
ncbi:MAG: T9SS type A sorting domain-containing protein [Chitinophagaceae bacterium]|nr:MAG: T9SS type A sorting domain-containing protein [Chitinophagaceae bacterium]